MDDERRGLPSASGLERLALCPGSLKLEQQCPEIESDAAAEGTLLHAVLAGERSASDLTDDQMWVVDRCREMEALVVEQLGFDGAEEMRERRLWDDDTEPTFSGKPDAIYLKNGPALCVDYKTGRGEVAAAEGNWQMRGLAFLTAINCCAVHAPVFVSVIQPRTANSITLAQYNYEDIERARNDIQHILTVAARDDAPRIPGESQCRHCRAKGICPEAREAAIESAQEATTAIVAPDMMTLPVLTGADYATLLPQIKFAEEIFKQIEQGARDYIAAGGTIPGYELKPGTSRREIVDAQAAYGAIGDMVTPEEFAGVCKVPIGKLEALYGDKAGLKGKRLKEAFGERLGDAIETKTSAPSLVRVDASKRLEAGDGA